MLSKKKLNINFFTHLIIFIILSNLKISFNAIVLKHTPFVDKIGYLLSISIMVIQNIINFKLI
jgi:hypothetical protein